MINVTLVPLHYSIFSPQPLLSWQETSLNTLKIPIKCGTGQVDISMKSTLEFDMIRSDKTAVTYTEHHVPSLVLTTLHVGLDEVCATINPCTCPESHRSWVSSESGIEFANSPGCKCGCSCEHKKYLQSKPASSILYLKLSALDSCKWYYNLPFLKLHCLVILFKPSDATD